MPSHCAAESDGREVATSKERGTIEVLGDEGSTTARSMPASNVIMSFVRLTLRRVFKN